MDRNSLLQLYEGNLAEEIAKELCCRLELDKDRSRAPGLMVMGALTEKEEQTLASHFLLHKLSDGEKGGAYEAAVAAELSPTAMAALARGISADRETACMLNLLLEGKKVYLLERGLIYRKYKETASKTLYCLLQEYEKKLENLGIEIVPDVLDIRGFEGGGSPFREEELFDLRGKKLLRESDFHKARGSGAGAVLVERHAILTPLACDYAADRSLKIIRE